MLVSVADGMIKLSKPYDRHHDESNMKMQDLASLQDELFKPNLDTTIPRGRGLNRYNGYSSIKHGLEILRANPKLVINIFRI